MARAKVTQNRMVRLERRGVGPAAADRVREAGDRLDVVGRQQELDRAAEPGGRPAIEKGCRIDGAGVPAVLLREEADDRQVVAEDADAAYRGSRPAGNRFHVGRPVGNRGEEVQLDGRLEGVAAVDAVRALEEQFGGRRSPARRPGRFRRVCLLTHLCVSPVRLLGRCVPRRRRAIVAPGRAPGFHECGTTLVDNGRTARRLADGHARNAAIRLKAGRTGTISLHSSRRSMPRTLSACAAAPGRAILHWRRAGDRTTIPGRRTGTDNGKGDT